MLRFMSTRNKAALMCLPILLIVSTFLFMRFQTMRLMWSSQGRRDLRQAVSQYKPVLDQSVVLREMTGPFWFRPNTIEVNDGIIYTYTVVRDNDKWRVTGHRVYKQVNLPTCCESQRYKPK